MASQPAAGAWYRMSRSAIIRGYHAYKDIQEPENGETLELK